MSDGSEKLNGWLNLEAQCLHVIERCRKPNLKHNMCTVEA